MGAKLKVAGLIFLFFAAIVAMWYGAIFIVFLARWHKLWGVLLLAIGFRTMILILDNTLERPPPWTKRPWERPWEKETPGS